MANIVTDLIEAGGGAQRPELLVIHAMGENIRITEPYKTSRGVVIPPGEYPAHEWLKLLGISAHYLLHPDGHFTKCRHTDLIAWHAKDFNTNSVGIEVLVEGVYTYEEFLEQIKTDWVKPAQYSSLLELGSEIYNWWEMKDLKRHSDLSPGRKYDPGTGFKWDWFREKFYRRIR